MKIRSLALFRLFGWIVGFHAFPASAVIVAGANGGANNSHNTSAASLESAIPGAGDLFERVIRYSDASGIYLGYNPSTMEVWVMTARHVTNSNNSITIDGLSYQHVNRIQFNDDTLGDIELNSYTRPDNIMPNLPPLALATGVPTSSDLLVMIGHGRNRVQNASTDSHTSDAVPVATTTGYQWLGPRLQRWGTNHVLADFPDGSTVGPTRSLSLGGVNTIVYATDFTEPEAGEWLTSHEATGSLGDSGGGVFYHDGTQWVLSGIFTGVVGEDGQPAQTSGFGNLSLITDVSSYRHLITGYTGTLVPEPSSGLLLLTGGTAALVRRRRP